MRAWLYQPPAHRLRASYLIAPGLHYAGPADPRLDRFCRVLSGAGYNVLAPFLPDFMELRVRASLTEDLARCLDLLLSRPDWSCDRQPALFSISFGALPALRVASSPRFRSRLRRLFLFGGYANWSQTIEYCLTGCIDGRKHGQRDPLNQPVVFMNLLDALEAFDGDRPALDRAWMEYVRATWGRPEMKASERYQPLARIIASRLDPQLAETFLLGCGLRPKSYEYCREALGEPSLRALLDPGPSMAQVRCPVTIVHGLDDDVIPYSQSEQLYEGLKDVTKSELFLTGLVDHTRSVGKVGAGLREVIILRDICARLGSP